MDHGGKAVNDHSGIGLHVIFDPVEHQPDKGIFIDGGDEVLILLADGHARRLLVNDADQQLIGQLVEVIFDLLTADRAVDVQDKDLVFLHGLEDLQNSAKLCREGVPVKIEQLQVSRFRLTDTIMCCEECIGQY